MSGAVGAASGDLVLLVSNDVTTITITDTPVLGWVVGAPGAPATPVVNGKLTPIWGLCEIHPTHSPRELIDATPLASARAMAGAAALANFSITSPR